MLRNEATRSLYKCGHTENPCRINEKSDFMETELMLINTKPPQFCLKHRAAPRGSPASEIKHADWLHSDECFSMQTI